MRAQVLHRELDEDWNTGVEVEIAEILAEIEELLREFARSYSAK